MNAPALPPLTDLKAWSKEPTQEARLTLFAAGERAQPSVISPTRDALAAALAEAPAEIREAAVDAFEADEEACLVGFTLSEEGVKRDGNTVRQDGWDLAAYRRNPVVLWAHDYEAPPVGRSVATYLSNGALRGTTLFSREETQGAFVGGATIGRMVREGFLNAVSVGWRPLAWEISEERDDGESWWPPIDFLEQELLEYSIVPVPADAGALADGRALRRLSNADLLDLVAWHERQLDGETSLLIPRRDLEASAASWRKVYGESVRAKVDARRESAEVLGGTTADRLACPDCGHEAPAYAFRQVVDEQLRALDDVPTEVLVAALNERGAVQPPAEPPETEDDEPRVDTEGLRAVVREQVGSLMDDLRMELTGRLPD